jgi:hypothetical protein
VSIHFTGIVWPELAVLMVGRLSTGAKNPEKVYWVGLIVTDAVYSETPPSLSWILPLTVRVLLLLAVGQLLLLVEPNAP